MLSDLQNSTIFDDIVFTEDVYAQHPRDIRRRSLMVYLYMPVSIVYLEVMLRFLCGYDFTLGLPFAIAFSIGTGLAISLISTLFSTARGSRIFAGMMLAIICLVFTLEYFMFTSYRAFAFFDTIVFGAGNLIREFSDVMIGTVLLGIPKIIAFSVPFVMFIIITHRAVQFTAGESNMRIRRASAIVSALVIVIVGQSVALATNDQNRAAWSSEFNFESSSRRLGMVAGIGLNLRYRTLGNRHSGEDFLLEDIPPLNEIDLFEENPEDTSGNNIPISSMVSPAPSTTGNQTGEITEFPNDMLPTANGASDVNPPPDPPPPVEYGYNVMEIDFDAFIEQESSEKINAISEYVSELEGSRKNEYTGIFEGKNLILITAESFTKEVVDPVRTPTLYRMVNNGFYFSDFYQPAWGGSTSTGEFSVLTGIAPAYGPTSMSKTIGQNLSYTIGNKLMNLGYFSASYHNGSHTYYKRDKTHTNFGYSTYQAMGSGMEKYFTNGWPYSDLELMEYSVQQYINEQPFSVYYMTYSGHAAYAYGNPVCGKNWDAFPEFSDMSTRVRAYLACNLELEYAMEYLISALEEAGIADDTVIALAADHYPYGLEKSETWKNDKSYLPELFGFDVRTNADRDHNALIIWSGCLENEYKDLTIEIAEPTFTPDILPTLCNLFGVEYDSRLLVGRDVFSDAGALVFWMDHSWKTEYGYYNASRGEFTSNEDIEVPEDYIETVKAIVKNKLNYSTSVLINDYFNVLFNKDGTLRTFELDSPSDGSD